MEDLGKFLFLGAGAVSLFTFLTVTHWITTRAAERRDRERMALLRKLADQPPATAQVMRELLNEEDVRIQQQDLHKARAARHEGLQAGAILVAVGMGLSVFLRSMVPDKPVWTIGIMIMLIGVVVALFAYFSRDDESQREAPGYRSSQP